MKVSLTVVGVVVILMGAIWFLQGINVLPGSFMTGQRIWAIIGATSVVVGGLLVCIARSKR